VGYIKGKSAIAVASHFHGKQRNFAGENFWARGYAVSTVGYEEVKIRAYIKTRNSWIVDVIFRKKADLFNNGLNSF